MRICRGISYLMNWYSQRNKKLQSGLIITLLHLFHQENSNTRLSKQFENLHNYHAQKSDCAQNDTPVIDTLFTQDSMLSFLTILLHLYLHKKNYQLSGLNPQLEFINYRLRKRLVLCGIESVAFTSWCHYGDRSTMTGPEHIGCVHGYDALLLVSESNFVQNMSNTAHRMKI